MKKKKSLALQKLVISDLDDHQIKAKKEKKTIELYEQNSNSSASRSSGYIQRRKSVQVLVENSESRKELSNKRKSSTNL